MRVLIAGCGYVGGQLAAELVEDGQRVIALTRTPRAVPHGVFPLVADLTDADALRRVVPEVDAAVFCAAPGEGSEEGYQRVFVDGMTNLLACLEEKNKNAQVFFTSSTSVYAQEDGRMVDEASPTHPTHYSGQLMLKAEDLLTQSPLKTVILRCGGIYGPGRTRLIEAVQHGRATYSTLEQTYTNRVHRDDITGCIRFLLQRRDVRPLYVLVDSDPAPRADVLHWLAERLKAPTPRGEDTLHAGRLDSRSNKRCSNAWLKAGGYQFLYPSYREGYAAVLAEYLAQTRT